MEIEITRDCENRLLARREVEFVIRFEGSTPSRMQVLHKLSALLNANETTLVISSMKNHFGTSYVTGVARVYESADARTSIEPAHLVARSAPKVNEEGA